MIQICQEKATKKFKYSLPVFNLNQFVKAVTKLKAGP